jgi:hypothetical protein
VEVRENSAPKTLRVSHSFHSPYYYCPDDLRGRKEKRKQKKKPKATPFYFEGLDIHIAVDRARRAASKLEG